MRVSTRGKKWEIVTTIHKIVGEKEFIFSDLGPDMRGTQAYFKDLLFAKMIIRTKNKTATDPPVYKLPQNMLDMIQRHTE